MAVIITGVCIPIKWSDRRVAQKKICRGVSEMVGWRVHVWFQGTSQQFYVKRKLFCGECIESQYYNNMSRKKLNISSKRGRLVTGNIFEITIFYSFKYVFLDAEIKRTIILEKIILSLYTVIASIVILKS